MTEQQFLDDVSPLPEYTEFYYVNGDLSLGEFAFSRAYFRFKNFDELVVFKDKFDDYVFMDLKGNEFPAIVEYAPLQEMPRRSGDQKQTKQDLKINTIENDPDFIQFMEDLKQSNSNPSPPPYSADALLEEIDNRNQDKANEAKMTPLLEFVCKRYEEKSKIKDEKKRKKEETKKKKVEEKNKFNKEKIQVVNHPKDKVSNADRGCKENDTTKANKPGPSKESPRRKNEKKAKQPVGDATYVIKVNSVKSSDEHKDKKQTKDSAVIEMKQKEVYNKQSESVSKNRNDKDKEQGIRGRIRNKDRPAREIYRPGMKSKSQNHHEEGKQNSLPNEPSTCAVDQPETSKTNVQPKVLNSCDSNQDLPSDVKRNTSNQSVDGSNKKPHHIKYKTRSFTKTK